MSTWANVDDAIIDRYVRSLAVRTRRTRLGYRRELAAFHRFTTQYSENGNLTEEALTAWVKMRARKIPLSLVIDRAGTVNRFLDALVRQGILSINPFAALRDRYGQRRTAPIVRALAGPDPFSTLEALRPLPRWGSPLGPLMRDHIAFMRALGYRYGSQAVRFAAFDRFLQTRPDLTDQPLRTMIREWTDTDRSINHAWNCAQLGADLSRAWRRIDPTVELLPRDPDLKRQIQRQYRRPYIYTLAEVRQVLLTARELPAPRAPLVPVTVYTMFVLAYCAGLRLGEIVRLNLGDIDLTDCALEIRNTKFFKSRRVPLSESAFAALREYLELRRQRGGPLEPAAPVFWHDTRHRGRYSMVQAEKLLVKVLRRAGLKPVRGYAGPRVHDMRHAFAVHRLLAWYRQGVDPEPRLPYLVTYLGHKSIHSTLIYLTITQELLQEAGERYRTAGGARLLHAEGVSP